jgi:Lecithin retinol acyltransferase
MPTYSNGVPMKIGDWVKVWSPSGVWHHGIVFRMTFASWGMGYVEIINNVKAGGITVSDWNQFSGGRLVFLVKQASSPAHVEQILARAESSLGKPYNLFGQNCEHFASFAFNGKPQSDSIRLLGAVAAGVVIVKLLGDNAA